MEDTLRDRVISLLVTKEDYGIIMELFDREDEPAYSVVKAEEFKEEYMLIDLYVNSVENLWYLARKVQIISSHRESKKGKT